MYEKHDPKKKRPRVAKVMPMEWNVEQQNTHMVSILCTRKGLCPICTATCFVVVGAVPSVPPRNLPHRCSRDLAKTTLETPGQGAALECNPRIVLTCSADKRSFCFCQEPYRSQMTQRICRFLPHGRRCIIFGRRHNTGAGFGLAINGREASTM